MSLYFYFLLTLLIELPVVVIFFKRKWKTAVQVGFLLNLFTWPLLHLFLFETAFDINLLELIITIAEGLGYFILLKCKWWKAILLSFVANGLSYVAGLIINNY